ncbi:hypothetical protein [Herbaspirillum huttiense]|uniref:hypothetical protein n=1 Tax=Herbaspirillum huttiense TaxID=863372 RepID=UPI002176ACBE|nr:hypothetical protein [Herbaspirillum huttiense]UWE15188.1 hypothetical protein NY669_19120 [Herbaspirillum huttiense]
MTRTLIICTGWIDAACAWMSWIALNFSSIENPGFALARRSSRLSDAREMSDKNMLGFPTVTALRSSYDEPKFSGNAGTRHMSSSLIVPCLLLGNEGQPADACMIVSATATEVPIAFSAIECTTKDKGEQP